MVVKDTYSSHDILGSTKADVITPEECKALCTKEHKCSTVRLCKGVYGAYDPKSGKFMDKCERRSSKKEQISPIIKHAGCTDYYKKCHWSGNYT